MPWKMGAFTDGEYPEHSIDVSFKGMESDPELKAFHDKFIELEGKIIDAGVENSIPWFKKKSASREVVEAIFGPDAVRVSKDKETGEPIGKWSPI